MTTPAHPATRRIGVVLTGAGTAGAYHAGAMRAMAESGIQVDVIAGHGAGALAALATAIDGGHRIWSEEPWTGPQLASAYRFRRSLRVAGWILAVCLLLLLTPLVVLVLAAGVYAVAMLASLASLTTAAEALVAWYGGLIGWLFDPPMMPTIVPRLVLLGVVTMAAILALAAWRTLRTQPTRRHAADAFWWQMLAWPIDATEPARTAITELWTLVHGASAASKPDMDELGRRYVDVLTDNFGQPGFHEVIVGVHDVDAGRDVVGCVLSAAGRSVVERRRPGVDERRAEYVDFTGPERGALGAFLIGAFRLPVISAPATVQFAADSYWQGERHRICDRPDLAARLVDEVLAYGVDQIVLVSAAPEPAARHQLNPPPVRLRARMGEVLRSFESAATTEAAAVASASSARVVVIRPDHNPIGPFDFEGVFDARSDRRRTVAELLQQGYADAYHHFIEPLLAAGDG